MSKAGKCLPEFVKRPIVRFTNRCGRLKGKVYLAARAGKSILFRYTEWYYKNVRPSLIAEKYLEEMSEVGFADYKFLM